MIPPVCALGMLSTEVGTRDGDTAATDKLSEVKNGDPAAVPTDGEPMPKEPCTDEVNNRVRSTFYNKDPVFTKAMEDNDPTTRGASIHITK